MVNPRFQRYSRPLLLAVPVGIITFLAVVGVGVFNFINSEDCTERPMQFTGTSKDHATFIKPLLKLKDGELTRKLCISNMNTLVVNGASQVVNQPCSVTELIMGRIGEDLELIPEPSGDGWLTEFTEECEGEDSSTASSCQPDLTYVISYKSQVCTRISNPLFAIGAAAGLQEQISFVLTIIFILIFSKAGCITVKSGKMFGAVADEQSQIDELKKEIEMLQQKKAGTV